MSRSIKNQEITIFMNELFSESATPGGGAAAGVGGALAASLAAMVANLTVNKEKYAEVQKEMEEVLKTAKEYQEKMLFLADADAEAFSLFMSAYGLPKDTEGEKEERTTAIQRACKKAATIPLETAKVAVGIMEITKVVVTKGNPSIVTDGAAAALFARAALRVSAYNVRINLNSIKDANFTVEAKNILEQCENKSEVLEKEIIEATNAVLGV